MSALAGSSYRQHGFTMIELLVVILIIGLLAGVATVAIFSDSDNTRLKRAASTLQSEVELMAEEAQLLGVNFGLLLSHDDDEIWSYRWRSELAVGEREEDQTEQDWWLPLGGELRELFLPRQFSADVELELRLDGNDTIPLDIGHEDDEKLPQIFFYRNGEMTPFQLQLVSTNGDSHFELQGDMLGRVTVVDKLNEE